MGLDYIRAQTGKPWRKRWDGGLDRLKAPTLLDLTMSEASRVVTAQLDPAARVKAGDIGDVLPVIDGFVVNLSRTQVGVFDPPQWSEGKQQWLAGHLVLQGSGDYKPLITIDTQNGGGWAAHGGLSDLVVVNASVPYRGQLVVRCVPKSSIWELTISDIPVVRPPRPTYGDGVAFGDGNGFKHPPLRPPRELALIER